ncbi:MAG: asparagine synthase (glutamine-hydrolyzing) [bacterium]
MCGIVGIYDPEGRFDRSALIRMNSEMNHRGPDDEGYHLDPPIGLAMRRLSIIDLAGGKQPIANEDETCWIVFNGEIYNYRERRAELLQKGHAFKTKSDTETILHLYEELGDECVHQLNGMFGFAIWDKAKRRLFVARDRLGIKPVYYFWDGRTLIFASEIKAILASDLVTKEVNPEAIWNYLTFRYIPEPLTIWKKIYKIPPGHVLTLNANESALTTRRYWDIPYGAEETNSGEDEDLEVFSSLFLNAVQRRLIADVPVGILLSGGLDSSAVAAAVSEVHNAPLSTFSVAFEDGGEFSELNYARQIAERYGTDHHEIIINLQHFLDFLPEFVWHTDEPLADPASVPLYYVAKLASERVKVVLSGEGADEVLAGYHFNRSAQYWHKLSRFQRLPRWMRDTIPTAVFKAVGYTRGAQRLELLNLPLAERNRRLLPHMTNYFTSVEKRSLWPDVPFLPDSDGIIAGYYKRAQTNDPLHQMLYAYCQDWLVEDLLMKADKMTMANSLELRVPFLDHTLVEWLARCPAERKVKRNGNGAYTTKYLLRRFAGERLPRAILERPKQGFPVPLNSWLRASFGQLAEETVLSKDSRICNWFRRESLKDLFEENKGSDSPTDLHRLWILFVLEIWARRWL